MDKILSDSFCTAPSQAQGLTSDACPKDACGRTAGGGIALLRQLGLGRRRREAWSEVPRPLSLQGRRGSSARW